MLAHSFDPLLLRLVKTPVETIKPTQPRSYSVSGVLHAELDQPLSEVFKNLSEQGVMSLPVVSNKRLRFFEGFVDLWDCVAFVARTFVDFHWADYSEVRLTESVLTPWTDFTCSYTFHRALAV